MASRAARENNDGGDQQQLQIQFNNQKLALAFRQKVAALTRATANKQVVNNFMSVGADGEQHLVRLIKDPLTDKHELLELNGPIRNIPRALRGKRTADEAGGDDEDVAEEEENNNNNIHPEQDQQVYDEARGMMPPPAKKKNKTSKASSKKQKPAPVAANDRSSRHNRDQEANNAVPSAGSRRSTRVTGSSGSSSSGGRRSDANSRTSRREPRIREDEEENHVTVAPASSVDDTDADHVVDERHLRRSLRAASDDLNSLSDRMNNFEIKSEAGSESTHIFSREGSLAGPVASTSAH